MQPSSSRCVTRREMQPSSHTYLYPILHVCISVASRDRRTASRERYSCVSPEHACTCTSCLFACCGCYCGAAALLMHPCCILLSVLVLSHSNPISPLIVPRSSVIKHYISTAYNDMHSWWYKATLWNMPYERMRSAMGRKGTGTGGANTTRKQNHKRTRTRPAACCVTLHVCCGCVV